MALTTSAHGGSGRRADVDATACAPRGGPSIACGVQLQLRESIGVIRTLPCACVEGLVGPRADTAGIPLQAVNELPFLEHEHHESGREQQQDQPIHAYMVDDESVGNDSNGCAEESRMTYCSIDSVLQQLALSLLGARQLWDAYQSGNAQLSPVLELEPGRHTVEDERD